MRLVNCVLLIAAAASDVRLLAGEGPPAVIDVADRKRLTWDDSLMDKAEGIRFQMHAPHRTGDRCVVAEKPWESWQIGGMSSLLHENGKFRSWYGVSHGIRHGEEYAVAYAESDDGIHWEKPELGLVEYDGSTRNNLVVGYSSVIGQVFVDPHAESEAKYKMLVAIYPTKDDDPQRYLTLLHSRDGLSWTKPGNNILPAGDVALDTQSQAFWDRDRNKYVLFTRMGPWRQVGRTESADPFRFPPPDYAMQPDDKVQADYYQAGVTKYEEAANAYFAVVPVFFHPGDAEGNPANGNPPLTVSYSGNPLTVVAPDTLDLHLFTSNDSVAWLRRGDHAPFIGLGPESSFDSRSLYAGVGYAVVGDEIWLYYSAYDCTHIGSLDGESPFQNYLGTITRATLRLDGFVSANAGHDGAEIVTKTLVFEGEHLVLNVDCSAGGHVDVELLSDEGEPIPGFSAADCDRVYHNYIRKTVTWNGRSDLTELIGRRVRLRLLLRDARLYSFQFASPEPQP